MTVETPLIPAPTASPDLVKQAVKYETQAPSTEMIPRVSAMGLAGDISTLAREAIADAMRDVQTGHIPPSFWRKLTRQSDRLLTPLSLSIITLSGVGLIFGILFLMIHVQQEGGNPQTVLNNAVEIIGTLTGLFTSGLLVMHRQQTSRIERGVNSK